MFHGRKKVDKSKQAELSEKELNDIKVKLDKINQNNQILLTKRQNKEYTWETLTQTEKFSFLSPDFTTLWNYRREILLHLFKNDEKVKNNFGQQLTMIQDELKFLVKAIMRSPKSYTLWFQRQWAIEQGLQFESNILADQVFKDANAETQITEIKSQILENELLLCDKMLKMDERNFHCWNYRLWVVDIYLNEFEKRTVQFKMDQCFEKHQKVLIEKECEVAFELIKKSFSNFSAWHYRSRLIPKIYNQNGNKIFPQKYLIPYEIIKSDLSLLKHAFFTDPKDQSPWNYQELLLQQIIPVQVVNLSVLKYHQDSQFYLTVGLSHKVRNFDELQINATQNGLQLHVNVYHNQNGLSSENENIISSKWIIKIDLLENDSSNIELSITNQVIILQKQFFHSIEGLTLFRPLIVEFNINTYEIQVKSILSNHEIQTLLKDQKSENLIVNLSEILKQEQETIQELTDFEEGLGYAIHRLLELKMIQYHYLQNPFYSLDEVFDQFRNDKSEDLIRFVNQEPKSILEEVNKLIEQLMNLENSQINQKLFLQKEQKNFQILFERQKEFKGCQKLECKDIEEKENKEICDRYQGNF